MAQWLFGDAAARAEYEAVWIEAWDFSCAPAEVAKKALELLRDAEQAARPWAASVLDAALLDGLTSVGKKWRKAKEPKVLVSYHGEVVGKTNSAFSVLRRDEDSGETSFELRLFTEMKWEEVFVGLADSERTSAAAQVTGAAYRKMLTLLPLHPDSVGPDEAAGLEGMTLEEFLASDGVAS